RRGLLSRHSSALALPRPLFLLPRLLLKDMLGLLQLRLLLRRQVLPPPVDEELNPANPRADSPGTHLLARHHPRDGRGILGERFLWRRSGHLLDGLHPFLLVLSHDSLRNDIERTPM